VGLLTPECALHVGSDLHPAKRGSGRCAGDPAAALDRANLFRNVCYHVPLLLIVQALLPGLRASMGVIPRAGIFVLWVLAVLVVSDASFRWWRRHF